ncbi:hypothetical protein TVAG_318640 [Trichomonas vaginalis G3]|uniref:Uncharacterized protein n=1 Tax=Trichomonas vaginalis (strain ATCC PRA-98 / G3) TaxID=412133 RepID=A2G5L4_TRIV3|nr:hypothetical protein TVAGG3_0662330 [Trichomonas vaginalis G3]EAX87549.1 hypothetical protein TVAG_318640 [Trichomonas vaginalis G3]KAI5506584.1 hypothetical protein TVAGG3_0662330 [Trichomonas vaginalis G3]|eukprot:XP_001300479.1 hypothetical protein [Trichomonas vaginalis G3]
MNTLSDADFFKKIGNILEDSPPEAIIKDPEILQRIQDCILSFEPLENLQALQFLRAWCRKLAIRVKLENDNRINHQNSSDLSKSFKNMIERFTTTYANLTISLFRKPPLLPLAVCTCKELLSITNSSPSDDIIEYCLMNLSNKDVRLQLLGILANSKTVIDELPVYDPEIAIQHPFLHNQLVNISPPEVQGNIKTIRMLYNQIQKINLQEGRPDRNLLEYCDFEKIFGIVSNEILASHPSLKVRKDFYNQVINSQVNVTTFLNSLLTCNIFDVCLKDFAIQLVKDHIDEIIKQNLTQTQIISLQMIPMSEGSVIYTALEDYFERTDKLTAINGWCRFLFHKSEWIRSQALEKLNSLLNFKLDYNPSQIFIADTLANDFMTRQKLPGKKNDPAMISSFIDTILNKDQQEFIKTTASKRLVDMYMNPYNQVQQYTKKLMNLEFDKYPTLIHAVSIRDSNFLIDTEERIIDLLSKINQQTINDLIQILIKTVFSPIIKIEIDGSCLLRLPRYSENLYKIPTACGFYDKEIYNGTEKIPFSETIKEWCEYKNKIEKPLTDEIDLRTLSKLSTSNVKFAMDIVDQIKDDKNLLEEKFSKLGKIPNVLHFLLILVLNTKTSTDSICEFCFHHFLESPEIGFKLAEALTEFGGFIELPDTINELIENDETRRSALAFVTAKLNKKQEINKVNLEKIENLLKNENLPTNVLRQVLTIISSFNVRIPEASLFFNSKDPVIKSLSFHLAKINKETANECLNIIFNDNEAVITRTVCINLLSEYYQTNEPESNKFIDLFYHQKGETSFTFSLLKLLCVPRIREQITIYEDFILEFLDSKATERFTKTALYSLNSHEIQNTQIITLLGNLINDDRYTNIVLHLLTTFSEKTLALFTSEMIFYITDALQQFDINLCLISINKLMNANVAFPDQSMIHVLTLYKAIVERRSHSELLRTVMKQIFFVSKSARNIALKNGFLQICLCEMLYAPSEHFYDIIKMVSVLIYNYKKGQDYILKVWDLKTLHSLFTVNPVILNFFLCYAKQNEKTQQSFSQVYNNTTLLDTILESIETAKKPSNIYLLLELFSNILNGKSVRNRLYINQRLIPHYVQLVQKYAMEKKVGPLEGWLRVFIMLTLHPDGVDKLYEFTRVPELLFVFFKSCAEIRNNRIFLTFLRNLMNDRKHWNSVKDSIIRECQDNQETELIKIFESLCAAAKNKAED